ncbi:hypothetical protein Syun_005625 [Stephania yunnanensis]|uniref:Homeobox domain-containing protein n=1 Tax=Stephania yunnanensis TaxID=152371 RepID=A0AAP0Q2F7_9MAGN
MAIMDWGKQQQLQQQQQQDQQQQSCGVMYVKVMTDEQMEVLRRQIAAYATICEQLVEMHKSITSQQDLAGMKLGNIYCDRLMTSTGHKITSRQRWTPTPVQLQILERIFDQGNGTPSRQKIKDIANELAQHGQISETNVYNWFQNRRARSKRKQTVATSNNGESEVETEDESPKEKKTKPESLHSHENLTLTPDEMCFQSPEISSELLSLDPQPSKAESSFPCNEVSTTSSGLAHASFYENMLSHSRIDQFMGKMEIPGNFSTYRQGENYDMI